jgi:LysM repeat protein
VIVSTIAVLAAAAPPAPARVPHTVEPGETLWSIALANDLTTRALAAANGLPAGAHILAGSTLSVPSVSEAASALARQVQPAGPGPGALGRYVVRPGDSLSAIAARSGVTVQELASLNGLDPTGTLLIGTRLRLPTGAPGDIQQRRDGHGLSSPGSTGSPANYREPTLLPALTPQPMKAGGGRSPQPLLQLHNPSTGEAPIVGPVHACCSSKAETLRGTARNACFSEAPSALPFGIQDRSGSRSGTGVARVRDAASKGLGFAQPELGALESLGKQPPAAALHDGIDEQPIRVDQTGPDHGVAQRDAAGDHDVLARLLFERRTSSTGSPERTVEFCHWGSVMVEETTYFCTRLR